MRTGVLPERFRFHNPKITAISDYSVDKQRFSGHKTLSQAERYNRTADEVKPVDG